METKKILFFFKRNLILIILTIVFFIWFRQQYKNEYELTNILNKYSVRLDNLTTEKELLYGTILLIFKNSPGPFPFLPNFLM